MKGKGLIWSPKSLIWPKHEVYVSAAGMFEE
jgi:hypothetical protein